MAEKKNNDIDSLARRKLLARIMKLTALGMAAESVESFGQVGGNGVAEFNTRSALPLSINAQAKDRIETSLQKAEDDHLTNGMGLALGAAGIYAGTRYGPYTGELALLKAEDDEARSKTFSEKMQARERAAAEEDPLVKSYARRRFMINGTAKVAGGAVLTLGMFNRGGGKGLREGPEIVTRNLPRDLAKTERQRLEDALKVTTVDGDATISLGNGEVAGGLALYAAAKLMDKKNAQTHAMKIEETIKKNREIRPGINGRS